jgi:uncharacterized protein YnzC (UPF0291/DUF896 family)
MEKSKLDRINELARLKRERELTEDEVSEQKALRMEYIAEFRASMTGILDNTVIKRPDGTVEKVSDRKGDKD